MSTWGVCFWLGPRLVLEAGSQGPGSDPVDRGLRLGQVPKPREDAAGVLELGSIFGRKVHASGPEGCIPRAPGQS